MRTMSGGRCLHYDCSNRSSFGYCKTTVCINEHYQQEQWGSPSTTNKAAEQVMADNHLGNWIHPKNKYPYTFKCEFLLPEPWDNEKNQERFENSIYKAFMEAFPDGVDIINRGLYFEGSIQMGHEQTLVCQDKEGEWCIRGDHYNRTKEMEAEE